MATQFEEELEIFRTETQKATQCFYAFLSVHAVAADRDAVRRLLNMAALFWNTSLGALQTSTFIALGRIFDQGSRHNVDSLFKTAQDDLAVFSKDALATRKQGTNPVPPEWLAEYLRTAYVPTATDFRRLRGYVRRYRKIYESRYRDIRRKYFAHRELSTQSEVSLLFGKTNIRELQRLLVFLAALHEALWQLYFNGVKPTLRAQRYSVERIRKRPLPPSHVGTVQEHMTREVEQFLCSVAGAAEQAVAADRDTASRARRERGVAIVRSRRA
jgi:hypothetical protein